MIATLLAATSNPNGFAGLIVFIPLILVFYFLMIRPQRNRMKQHQELLQHVEVGDEVETIGGIFGTIKGVTEGEFLLEISPGSTVRITRAAVRRKIYQQEEQEEEQESPDSTP